MVAARDLRKEYRMGDTVVAALDGVSLEIARGEMVAIMGPSGSGKSTLMNLIGALDVPTSGSIVIDGVALETADSAALADLRSRAIGFVFQQFQLLARLPALDNVAMPLLYARSFTGDAKAIARDRLSRVGLAERSHHLPTELSGGQQQRVAIARALVNDPAILLADEPTGALDSRTGRSIIRLFQDLNAAGQTVVMVTHDEGVARACNRIVRFRDGRIVEDAKNADVWRPEIEEAA
ncbi:MAG: ABC transporter ATP-binding protein [Alphaproteobacteria bacterium]|nr:ABC transporter ATP-binding protein [Alphaproteobacteria bacterium]